MIDYFYVSALEEKSQAVVYVYAGYRHVLAEPLLLTLTDLHLQEVVVDESPKEVRGEEKPKVVVYFGFNSAKLTDREKEKLKGLEPSSSYTIIGYADWIGSERYNFKLSERRAREVAELLKGFNVKLEWRGESECNLKPNAKGKKLIQLLQECRKVEIW